MDFDPIDDEDRERMLRQQHYERSMQTLALIVFAVLIIYGIGFFSS